ncbi:hypothetical protein [Georgenia sp. Z1491]|uniref:hypothetical protein n=1 Tax=Georgenia sp. Z1491 TaxID=3416707 RepID=UPI003CF3792B
MLDREARRELLTLSKTNGEAVARHLVMAGILLEDDPERAYQHAQAAGRGAGRVATAREAVAITAYATGRFAEALKELRAVRRLSGRDDHRVMEADCERGLGRPERALTVVAETDASTLSEAERAELAIVASGARADLGENEAGLLLLRTVALDAITDRAVRARLDSVIADRLDEVGRTDEAAEVRSRISIPTDDSTDTFDVIDLLPEEDEAGQAVSEASTEAPVAASDPDVEESEAAVEPDVVEHADVTDAQEVEPDPEPSSEQEVEPDPEPSAEQGAEPEAEQGQLDLGLDLGEAEPRGGRPATEEPGSDTMGR